MHTYQQTSHFTEPIVEPEKGQNRIKNISKKPNDKEGNKNEIIENDKKNEISEWEGKKLN